MNTAGASPSCARQRRAARLTGSAQRHGSALSRLQRADRRHGRPQPRSLGPRVARSPPRPVVGDACRIEDAIGQELHPVGDEEPRERVHPNEQDPMPSERRHEDPQEGQAAHDGDADAWQRSTTLSTTGSGRRGDAWAGPQCRTFPAWTRTARTGGAVGLSTRTDPSEDASTTDLNWRQHGLLLVETPALNEDQIQRCQPLLQPAPPEARSSPRCRARQTNPVAVWSVTPPEAPRRTTRLPFVEHHDRVYCPLAAPHLSRFPERPSIVAPDLGDAVPSPRRHL